MTIARRMTIALLLAIAALAGLPARAIAQTGVCLLISPSNARFFASQGADESRVLATWRALLARRTQPVCELGAAELAQRRPALLVLASSVALDARERSAIEAYANAGGALLATWATGSRDEHGQWQGYGWLRELFGVEVAGEIGPASDERHLLPFGESPLTTSLGAGRRLFLTRSVEPMLRARLHEAPRDFVQPPAAAADTAPVASAAARYGVWHRHAHQGVGGLAALTHLEHRGSRRVWLGVPEAAWPASQQAIETIIGDALAWATREPRAVLSAWPAPYRSAFLVEMDTEEKFGNAVNFAATLDRHGLVATFYCLSSEAAKFPELVRSLGRRHEIAYHGDLHNGFKDLPSAAQDNRLAAMIEQLAPMVRGARKPSGFRAPLESYDRQTEILLRRRGLRHHAADPAASDDMLPAFSPSEPHLPPSEALVVLPRTLLDDINFVRMGVAGDGVRAELMLGLEDIERFRGFGLLSVHTQNYPAGGELDLAMQGLLAELARRRDRNWVTTGENLERWWRDRAAIRLRWLAGAPQTLRFELDAPGTSRPIEGAQMIVLAPSPDRVPVLSAEGAQSASAPMPVARRLDPDRWSLPLPPVTATPRTYTLRFVPR